MKYSNCFKKTKIWVNKNYGWKFKEFSQKIVSGARSFCQWVFFLAFKEHIIPMVRNCSRDYKKMEICLVNIMKSVWVSYFMGVRFFWGDYFFSFYCKHRFFLKLRQLREKKPEIKTLDKDVFSSINTFTGVPSTLHSFE